MECIRYAGLNDVEIMSYIHAQTWKAAYKGYISESYLKNLSYDKWVPVFTQAFQNSGFYAALFNINNKNTGCITFGKARDENLNNYGEIISLYVLPEYWSTKQGYKLTQFALRELKKNGFEHCYIWVLKENIRAVNFYEKVGFVNDAIDMFYNLEGQDLNEVRYSIKL